MVGIWVVMIKYFKFLYASEHFHNRTLKKKRKSKWEQLDIVILHWLNWSLPCCVSLKKILPWKPNKMFWLFRTNPQPFKPVCAAIYFSLSGAPCFCVPLCTSILLSSSSLNGGAALFPSLWSLPWQSLQPLVFNRTLTLTTSTSIFSAIFIQEHQLFILNCLLLASFWVSLDSLAWTSKSL